MREYRLDVVAMYLEKSIEDIERVISTLAHYSMFNDFQRLNWEIGINKLYAKTEGHVWLNINVLEEVFNYLIIDFDDEALNNWIHLVYTSDYPSDTNPYRD